MIKNYLLTQHQSSRLHSSYLISTDDNQRLLSDVESFLNDAFFAGNLNNSSDYLVIKRLDNKTKNINIAQIRSIQSFLQQTSVLTGNKIVVIYAADEMNINSYNSCLKILEEPTKDSYIFLITENPNHLPETIKSRCIELTNYYHLSEQKTLDVQLIKPLLKTTNLSDQLKFIQTFDAKDRNSWSNFTFQIDLLLTRLTKRKLGVDIEFSQEEEVLFRQMGHQSLLWFQQKYDSIQSIINQTNQYDLELKTSVLLIIETIRQ